MAWCAELPSGTRPEAELYQARRPILLALGKPSTKRLESYNRPNKSVM
jgi:hypothetical protein